MGAAALGGGDGDADGDLDHELGGDVDHEFGADLDHDLALGDAADAFSLDVDMETGVLEGAAGALELDLETDVADLGDLPAADVGHAAELMLGADPVDAVAPRREPVWLPLLSLRFWTYGSCFFGLSGGLLTTLTPGAPRLILGLALAMGLGCGYVASWTFRRLRRAPLITALGPRHFAGAIGTVLVPVGTDRPGKVRVRLRDQEHDLLARSAEDVDLPRGTRVLVIEYRDETARVVHAGRLLAAPGDAAAGDED